MKRQHGVSIVNALLVIGLTVSVIGLLIAAISPSAAAGETRTELWINAPSSIHSMSRLYDPEYRRRRCPRDQGRRPGRLDARPGARREPLSVTTA